MMNKLILFVFALLAITSCTYQEILGERSGEVAERIVFGSSIETITRVRDDAATAFENDERIGVFGYRRAVAGATTDFTQDLFLNRVEFTYDATTPGAEKFASTHTDAVWELGSAHNFYAYYPTTLTVTNAAAGATAPLTVAEGTGIDAANDVMVANISTPVYEGETMDQALVFRHVLSKVNFKIKKEKDMTPDTKLTNVTFDMKSNAGSVNLMTGLVANTIGNVTLDNGDMPAEQLVTTTTVVDIPGSWLVLPDDEISRMIFTLDGNQMEVSGAAIPTVAGKITVVTITVKANEISFTANIIPWNEDAKEVSGLVPVKVGPIITYGRPPFTNPEYFKLYPQTRSYNAYYGTVADGHNGAYTETIYDIEEHSYYRFEVALTDAYKGDGTKDWSALYGTRPDHSDNICVQKHGKGWRMPRVLELEVISTNNSTEFSDKLRELGGEGLDGVYWSATEVEASKSWYIAVVAGASPMANEKTDKTKWVRCIKELPVQTGPILEYGVAPFDKTGPLTGSTTTSYNSYYGSVADGSNGAYYATAEEAYTKEKPYYKFEVAFRLAVASMYRKDYSMLVGALADHSDNECVKMHGEGWRMARMSEMRLITENAAKLDAEFEKLDGDLYQDSWSMTEASVDEVWYPSIDRDDKINKLSRSMTLRCIREIKP